MGSRKAQDDKNRPVDLNTDDLLLDEKNPRLGGEEKRTQQELVQVLWSEFAVDEVALSIAENGFFRYEPLFVTPENVVVEGNRRLAAVKLLRSEELRQAVGATTLPKLSSKELKALDTLPAIVNDRSEVWAFTGFKHINGPQPWNSQAKAQYVAWVHDTLDVPLSKIAETIGDKHTTAERLYHAHRVLMQAESTGKWKTSDRHKAHFSFSHLMTGLGYAGIYKFLGLTPESRQKQNPVPKDKLGHLEELLVWLFGSKSKKKVPVVQSQNPDLRILDEVIQNERGITALRRGLPLRVAADLAKGDEQVFRAALQQAKEGLKAAAGVVVTGFVPATDKDSVTMALDITKMARKLQSDMESLVDEAEASSQSKKKTAKKKSGKK